MLYYDSFGWADLDVYFDLKKKIDGASMDEAREKSPQYYFESLGWDEDMWKVQNFPKITIHGTGYAPDSFTKSWAQLNNDEREAATSKYRQKISSAGPHGTTIKNLTSFISHKSPWV